MTRLKKETAWKKSKKFGDIKGGRTKYKWLNEIINRFHNLEAPDFNRDTPIYLQDNPSKDFFFPVDVEEIKDFLQIIPDYQLQELSYIWLKRISKKDYEKTDSFQGCYIWGAGVQIIVLHPFPKDLKMHFGKKKPSSRTLNWYKSYCTDLREEKDNWYLQWTESGIKNYYLKGLLLHEIGHHMDGVYKHSKATQTKAENWADGYAFYWANKIRSKMES